MAETARQPLVTIVTSEVTETHFLARYGAAQAGGCIS